MEENPSENPQASEGGSIGMLNPRYAGALESILDKASSMYPAEASHVGFSIVKTEETPLEDLGRQFARLPVVAGIALRKEIGDKAAILTDVPTAIALVGAVSDEVPEPSEELANLSENDLVSLYDALTPITDALSNVCEEVMASPLGAIENVEVCDLSAHRQMAAKFTERLCTADIAVSVSGGGSGRIALILPVNLAQNLAEAPGLQPVSGKRDASESPEDIMEQDETHNFAQDDLVQDDIDALLQQAEGVTAEEGQPVEEEIAIEEEPPPPPPKSAAPPPVQPPMPEPQRQHRPARGQSVQNIDLILDIHLTLNARLGQVEMPIAEILKLAPGSVIDIDRFADEPVELVVNNRLIARGEIVVVQDNFGLKITEIISPKERIESLR